MTKYKNIIYAFAGLIVVIGIAWIVGSQPSQETAMLSPATTTTITPDQIPVGGTPVQPATATPNKTIKPTATTKKTASPTATQSTSPSQTAVTTPTQTTASTPTQTLVSTPTQTATATSEPTPAFSYSVYNDDGVAPAGYTIVYVKITPNGSYHVTYDGKTITKSKSGSGTITYYTTVEKLEGGGYRSKVRVTVN